MDHEADDPGTDWNDRARKARPDWMSPRMAWRAIQSALPKEAIISSDIGNNCAIGNAYPSFQAGRKYLAPGLFGPCGDGCAAIVGAEIGSAPPRVAGLAGVGGGGRSMSGMVAGGGVHWGSTTRWDRHSDVAAAGKRRTTRR